MSRRRSCALGLLVCVLACDAAETPGPDASQRQDAGGADAPASDAFTPDAFAPDAELEDAGTGDCDLQQETTDHQRYERLLACLEAAELNADGKTALILDFVALVEAHDGFPIAHPSGAFIFAYVRSPLLDAEDDRSTTEDFEPSRRQEPIRVAFDLAEVASSTITLERKYLDFYAAQVTVSNPAGQRYRFVAKDGQDRDWPFSDPLSRRFDFDAGGRYSLVRGDLTDGHLEWIRAVQATRLNVTRPIYLYVPPAYDQGTERYSALYMHDGNNLFHPNVPRSAPAGTWNVHFVMERELAGGHVRPGLIVGIPNDDNRFGEYTHVEDDIGGAVVGGDADDYADFIVNELKPLIDTRYRTLADRANSGVMGSSLGGLVSFHIGALHPEVFRFVGGMSSTFIWGKIGLANETMLERYAALTDLAARDQVFYLDSGGGPAPACPDGQDNYCETIIMRDTLVAGGIDRFPPDPDASPLPAETNIMHWWTPNAPHNESAWFARVHRPLRLFFRPE